MLTTPGFLEVTPKDKEQMLRPVRPEVVAEQALDALARGPVEIPGRFNRFAAFLMTRLLPRKTAVALGARTTRKVYAGE